LEFERRELATGDNRAFLCDQNAGSGNVPGAIALYASWLSSSASSRRARSVTDAADEAGSRSGSDVVEKIGSRSNPRSSCSSSLEVTSWSGKAMPPRSLRASNSASPMCSTKRHRFGGTGEEPFRSEPRAAVMMSGASLGIKDEVTSTSARGAKGAAVGDKALCVNGGLAALILAGLCGGTPGLKSGAFGFSGTDKAGRPFGTNGTASGSSDAMAESVTVDVEDVTAGIEVETDFGMNGTAAGLNVTGAELGENDVATTFGMKGGVVAFGVNCFMVGLNATASGFGVNNPTSAVGVCGTVSWSTMAMFSTALDNQSFTDTG